MRLLTQRSVGELIQYAREKQDITIFNLHLATKVEIRTLKKIENNEAGATLATYIKIFDALNIELTASFNQKKISTRKKKLNKK